MGEDLLQNNIGDTEVPEDSFVVPNTEVGEVQETIQYHPALLESRNEYISGRVQALYASYGVEDLEELTSKIEILSQAEELDKKITEIKKLREKYIPAVFQLGIRGSLDPTAKYEHEVIWSQDEMGVGVESFVIDLKNNIFVKDRDSNLHILEKAKGYQSTKIWSGAEKEQSEKVKIFIPDLENNLLMTDGHKLYILDSSSDYKCSVIWSEEKMGVGVLSFVLDLKNNIFVNDSKGNLHILDSSNGYNPTQIWSREDMQGVVIDFQPDFENNMLVKDNYSSLYLLDKSHGYKPTEIWSRTGGVEAIIFFKTNLENDILMLNKDDELYILDSSNDYRASKGMTGVSYFKLDLKNNILGLDRSLGLNIKDSSNDSQSTRIWSVGNFLFQPDLGNDILISDGSGDLNILDSSNNYKPTRIGSIRGLLITSLDYEGNIIVEWNISEIGGKTNLSILRPKKSK